MRCRVCGIENAETAEACVSCAAVLRTKTQLVHPTPIHGQAPRTATPAAVDLGLPDLAAPPSVPSPGPQRRPPSSLPASARTEGGRSADDEEARFGEGDVVLGNYVIERQLGRGGMGTVYLGRDDVSGQRVAIKVLPGSLARERDIRERFIQEARSLAALDHPGIVPLITFAQEDDDRFLVMKYVAGRPLDRLLSERDVLEPDEARGILREVAAALGYAHGKGVVHRDIKPANVLIDEGGHVVLVDFGIARKLEGEKRLTQTGMLMGTPQYMSPEQIEGHAVDGRADLYACGLLLFEMLSGRPPFDAEKTFDILKAHVEKPVPDLRALRSERKRDASPVPDDLIALCHALLEKSPDKRPKDGAMVIDALDGRTTFAAPPPTSPGYRIPGGEARPRTTTETPALAFTDSISSVDGDDEPIVAPSNPALWWTAGLALVAAGAVFGVVRFGNPLDALTPPVVDAGPPPQRFEMGVLLSRARLALERGNNDDARVAVDTALHLDPSDQEALLLRARVLIAGKNLTAAKETLARLPAALDAERAAERAAIELILNPPPKPKPSIEEQAEKPQKKPKKKSKSKSTKPEPAETAETASSKPRPSELDDDVLARITRKTRDALSNCYVEHVLSFDSAASGEVVLSVTVVPAGTVSVAQVTKNPFTSSEFTACVVGTVKTWSFPAFEGEPDSIVHKFFFRPG